MTMHIVMTNNGPTTEPIEEYSAARAISKLIPGSWVEFSFASSWTAEEWREYYAMSKPHWNHDRE